MLQCQKGHFWNTSYLKLLLNLYWSTAPKCTTTSNLVYIYRMGFGNIHHIATLKREHHQNDGDLGVSLWAHLLKVQTSSIYSQLSCVDKSPDQKPKIGTMSDIKVNTNHINWNPTLLRAARHADKALSAYIPMAVPCAGLTLLLLFAVQWNVNKKWWKVFFLTTWLGKN